MRHYCRSKLKPSRPREFNPRLQQLFGQVALELGDSAERCVDEALCKAKSEGRLPSWLLGWNRQEKCSEMDRKGIDFMFHTDVGSIFIQIKSSRRNAIRFEMGHQNDKIRTVVVDVRNSLVVIFQQVIGVVAKQRIEFLALRATTV